MQRTKIALYLAIIVATSAIGLALLRKIKRATRGEVVVDAPPRRTDTRCDHVGYGNGHYVRNRIGKHKGLVLVYPNPSASISDTDWCRLVGAVRATGVDTVAFDIEGDASKELEQLMMSLAKEHKRQVIAAGKTQIQHKNICVKQDDIQEALRKCFKGRPETTLALFVPHISTKLSVVANITTNSDPFNVGLVQTGDFVAPRAVSLKNFIDRSCSWVPQEQPISAYLRCNESLFNKHHLPFRMDEAMADRTMRCVEDNIHCRALSNLDPKAPFAQLNAAWLHVVCAGLQDVVSPGSLDKCSQNHVSAAAELYSRLTFDDPIVKSHIQTQAAVLQQILDKATPKETIDALQDVYGMRDYADAHPLLLCRIAHLMLQLGHFNMCVTIAKAGQVIPLNEDAMHIGSAGHSGVCLRETQIRCFLGAGQKRRAEEIRRALFEAHPDLASRTKNRILSAFNQ